MFSFNYEVFNFLQLNIILYILNVFLNSGPLNPVRTFIGSNFQNKQLVKTVSSELVVTRLPLSFVINFCDFLSIKFYRKIE